MIGDPRQAADERAAVRRRLRAMLRPRATRTQALVAVLCALLGFALVVQVQSNRGEAKFATARQDELVGVLDTLAQRSRRLRLQIQDLRASRARMESGSRRRDAILEDTRHRARVLGVLAGTLPAVGPGLVLTIDDKGGRVDARVFLDAVEELRDAGAEAIQIGDVRVVASTYFLDASGGGMSVDGHTLHAPYRIRVIGDARTMATALNIPGGVVETIRGKGASAEITQRERIKVTALRPAGRSQYARPASGSHPSPG
ncbi:MAG: DUF881 domain-containing protein [Streptosporangiaceae bacterium]